MTDPRDERRAPATAVERQIRHIMRDAVPPFGETIPRLVAYVEQFQAQRDELLAALADVMGHDEVSICAMVHHAKKDQHLAGQPCPVATRYLALLAKHGRRE